MSHYGPEADPIDGVQEGQAQFMAPWGEDVGPMPIHGTVKFPGGASSGRAGIASGYRAPDGFYIRLVD